MMRNRTAVFLAVGAFIFGVVVGSRKTYAPAVDEPTVLGMFQDSDSIVSASGRWTSDSLAKEHVPLRAVKINCFKDQKYCVVGSAIDHNGRLIPEAELHAVTSWTPGQIVLEESGDQCVRSQIMLDRATKRASMVVRNIRKKCSKMQEDTISGQPDQSTFDLLGTNDL